MDPAASSLRPTVDFHRLLRNTACQPPSPQSYSATSPTHCLIPIASKNGRSSAVTSLCGVWAVVLHLYGGAESISSRVQQDDEQCSYSFSVSQEDTFEAVLSSAVVQRSASDDQSQSSTTVSFVAESSLRGSLVKAATVDRATLELAISLNEEHCLASVVYSERAMSRELAYCVAETFTTAAASLFANTRMLIRDLNPMSESQFELLLRWDHQRLTPASNLTLIDVFLESARLHAGKIAITAHDGELTYQDLNLQSDRLAAHLVQRGVGLEVTVPIHFEKSLWAVVAMLAVLKAGGVVVPIDPALPDSRKLIMISNVNAFMLLVSDQTAASLPSSKLPKLLISQASVKNMPLPDVDPLPSSSTEAAAFIMHTSGSSGVPKAVVQEMGHLTTSIMAHTEEMGIDSTSSVLQFASFNFDVSISDIFGALMHGARICMPSDQDRLNNLSSVITEMRATHACITPTTARLLHASRVPSLRTLTLGGEKMTDDIVKTWAPHVRLQNIYGVTETTVWCAINPDVTEDEIPECIGRGTGAVLWIVNPENIDVLTPLGAMGELLIEGPIVARHYLNDPGKTATAFINQPSWLRQFRKGQDSKLYRTGDMVRYDVSNGKILYIGRRDNQTKLNGQRIELSEIESAVVAAVSIPIAVAAEAAPPSKSDEHGNTLVVFYVDEAQPLDYRSGLDEVKHNATHLTVLESTKEKLPNVLPHFMIPHVFLPLRKLPTTTTGKMDRQALRSMICQMTAEELAAFTVSSGQAKPLHRGAETVLATAWAIILDIDTKNISGDSNFFRMGGDSVRAILLADALRSEGDSLDVSDILRFPILSQMAEKLKHSNGINHHHSPERLSLLPIELREKAMDAACAQINVEASIVEDVMPCTALQEGIMAAALRKPGAYLSHDVYPLPADVSMNGLLQAWRDTENQHSTCRTRLIDIGGIGIFQVILRESTEHAHFNTLDECLISQRSKTYHLGDPLFCVSTAGDLGSSGSRHLIVSAHHAIYDGWSMSLLLGHVMEAYRTLKSQSSECSNIVMERTTPFSNFIQYLSGIDSTKARVFWKDYCAGVIIPDFPCSLGYESTRPSPDCTITRDILLPKKLSSAYTLSSIIQLSWALVTKAYSGSDDVVFGLTLSGRNAPVRDITRLTGPTFTTVPLRVRIDHLNTAEHVLKIMNEQAAERIPFEHVGLHSISQIDEHTAAACAFQTILVIQPQADQAAGFLNYEIVESRYLDAFNTYAVMLEFTQHAESLRVRASFDSAILPSKKMNGILMTFDTVLLQLLENQNVLLGNVQMCSNEEVQSLYNKQPPLYPLQCVCVQDLIAISYQNSPSKIVIESWDGCMTFLELDDLSTRLARYLVHIAGVQPSMIVPLCFEKSKWVLVAIIAVLKTGAAFVVLSASLPALRRDALIRRVNSSVIVASPTQGETLFATDRTVVAIQKNCSAFTCMEKIEYRSDPTRPCFVLWTSGSTGESKGVLVTHQAFSTSVLAHGLSESLSHSSRVFQFADFMFDVSLSDMLATLVFGGCVIIPSEEQRLNSLGQTMEAHKVSDVFLTPTVARMLSPAEIPSLKRLKLGGEPLSKEDILTWAQKVHLMNSYGVAECSVRSALRPNLSLTDDPRNIGFAVGCRCWLVAKDVRGQIVPVPTGARGEILVEGNTLADGYINDIAQTAAAFIQLPAWINCLGGDFVERRGYLTGDEGLLELDGTIQYLGRKDRQIKVRGQRVEAGEIEANLSKALDIPTSVVVELLTVPGRQNPVLVAFSSFEKDPRLGLSVDVTRSIMPINHYTANKLLAARRILEDSLPSYMVPDLFIPLHKMPQNASGKTDRRRLRAELHDLSENDVQQYSLVDRNSSSPPVTASEKLLANLWSRVLQIPPDSINREDHFLRLGGDSVIAMRLTSCARADGATLSVGDIFRHPKLSEQALVITTARIPLQSRQGTVSPFALLARRTNETLDISQVIPRWSQELGVDDDFIEDVYPCTPLQEGLITLSEKQRGAYMTQQIFNLPKDINLGRFKHAWQQIVDMNPIYRTRIVHDAMLGSLQVVIKPELIDWREQGDLEFYLKTDVAAPMGYTDPLNRFALIETRHDNYAFVWTIHHALYDGFSINLTFTALERLYHCGTCKPCHAFNVFIDYITSSDSDKAKAFWNEKLEGAVTNSFPPTAPPSDLSRVTFQESFVLERPATLNFTLATIVYAAWALLLSKYTATDDVVFSATLSGRTADLVGIDEIVGPTIATIPFRVQVDPNMEVTQLCHSIQEFTTEVTPFVHVGLQTISRLDSVGHVVSSLRNLLVLHTEFGTGDNTHDVLGEYRDDDYSQDFLNYPLVVECSLATRGSVVFRSNSAKSQFTITQCQRLFHQLKHLIVSLAGANEGERLGDINLLCEEDMSIICGWNSSAPPTKNITVHDDYHQVALSQPTAEAICAWDGDLTYFGLDNISTSLAGYLKERGLQPGDNAAFCFTKTKWAIVTHLAILKAGATCVPLDPVHPMQRKKLIISTVNAKMLLLSESVISETKDLHQQSFVVGGELIKTLQTYRRADLPQVQPNDVAFILFTSGSTGTPKGVEIPHITTTSSARDHGLKMLLDNQSRSFQFSSYTFDVAIFEIFTTLLFGGCVCIPSDSDRINSAALAMSQMRVNWALLTPSFVKTLRPSEVPSLRILVLGGEAVTQDLVEIWQDQLILINAYGPTEGSACVVGRILKDVTPSGTIGFPVGCRGWLVEPNNHNKLVPVGAVGELLIEGPTLAKGYFADSTRTAASFVQVNHGKRKEGFRRVYKTGDFCQYNEDGSLRYLGRKDTQLKIRGQRIEVEEVEINMRRLLPQGSEAVIDVVTPMDSLTKLLVAFIVLPHGLGNNGKDLDREFDILVSATRKALERIVPSYMIPKSFVRLESLPLTVTAKVDRRAIKARGEAMHMSQFTTKLRTKQPLENQNEHLLAKCWSKVLNIDVKDISGDDSFFELGGDSVHAISVVAQLRRYGQHLTVADIFEHSRIHDLCHSLKPAPNLSRIVTSTITPFSLLEMTSHEIDALRTTVADSCNVGSALISDMYPCTPLQQAFMAMSAKSPGVYTSSFIYKCSPRLDQDRLQRAVEVVVRNTPILRTRIIQYLHGTLQVVIDSEIDWEFSNSLEHYMGTIKHEPMILGRRLVRFASVTDTSARQCYFVWTMHHSLFDAWSYELMVKSIKDVYNGMKFPRTSDFRTFVKFVNNRDREETVAYWKAKLDGAPSCQFPRLPSASYRTLADKTYRRNFKLHRSLSSLVTLSTIIRAAWAIWLSKACNQDDVVFGSTLSGRGSTVPEVDVMVGPTITTIPVRVKVDATRPVREFLLYVQNLALEAMPHEFFGLQNIRRVSEHAAQACDLRTLLVIQTVKDGVNQSDFESLGLQSNMGRDGGFHTIPLVLDCSMGKDEVDFLVDYDSNLMSVKQVESMCGQLEHLMAQLVSIPRRNLSEVELVSSSEKEKILALNSERPQLLDAFVHDLVHQQTIKQPQAPAITAWDRSFSYYELDEAAEYLAVVLQDCFGVSSQKVVPVCFDKSAYAVVSLLGILKAGGVCTLLDPAYPIQRLQAMVAKTEATIVLTSQVQATRLSSLGVDVVITENILKKKTMQNVKPLNQSSIETAFIPWTSGTTGEPKGIKISHRNMSSTAIGYGRAVGISSSSRVLQFAAYSFDVSLGDIFVTLINGGCVCIPCEADRINNLGKAAHNLEANTAFLTSSLATALEPDDFPLLKSLVIGGEPLSPEVLRKWCDRTTLRVVYGPAECTVWCSITPQLEPISDIENIGRGIGARLWVVDIENSRRLAPIGLVGEILIEGPVVANGYFKDDAKTTAAFLDSLPWLQDEEVRAYKSGDLGRLALDGTVTILGRKDQQVKLRGQRLELGDVEAHVTNVLNNAYKAVAEVITTSDSPDTPLLAAFIGMEFKSASVNQDPIASAVEIAKTPVWQKLVSGIEDKLSERLPRYSIPTIFIPTQTFPTSASGKLDRQKLRAYAALFQTSQLRKFTTIEPSCAQPLATAMEIKIGQLWKEVLNNNTVDLDANDNFFKVGGDSIAAMHLAGVAQSFGFQLTTQQVFKTPILRDMALQTRVSSKHDRVAIPPFSLFGELVKEGPLRQELADVLNLDRDEIEDAYPCSPLQEGLIAASTREAGKFVARHWMELRSDINIPKLEQAWETVVQRHETLRTIIIHHNDRFVQVVMRGTSQLTFARSSEEFAERHALTSVGLRAPLSFAVLVSGERTTSLVWTVHHAVYDGWSQNLVLDDLAQAYRGETLEVEHPRFNTFIQYLEGRREEETTTEDFWRHSLKNVDAPRFPIPPGRRIRDRAYMSQKRSIALNGVVPSDITLSTIIRAAWAILIARYTNSNEVVIGMTVSGRDIAIPSTAGISGPMIATVPVRMTVSGSEPVASFLKKIQMEAVDMIDHQHYGIQRIRLLDESCAAACDFDTLLLIEPRNQGDGMSSDLFRVDDGSQMHDLTPFIIHSLMLQCHILQEGIDILATFDSNIIGHETVTRLLQQFERVLTQLCDKRSVSMINDVHVSSVDDFDQMSSPHEVENDIDHQNCIHELVGKQALLNPDKEAVVSWNGGYTYKELTEHAHHVATILQQSGVGLESRVCVLSEKRKEVPVLMLAILLIGATCVCLDSRFPPLRLYGLVKQSEACVIVSSLELSEKAIAIVGPYGESVKEAHPTIHKSSWAAPVILTLEKLVTERVALTPSHSNDTNGFSKRSNINPGTPAFIIFTSGSTGLSKGVLIEHQNLVAGGHCPTLNIDQTSRVLQFSPFTFDVGIMDIFSCLMRGGCVCIPSEDERIGDVGAACRRYAANWAYLTPSFVRTINSPSDLPLDTLVLGGEAVTQDNIDIWADKLKLYNGYGPTEAQICVAGRIPDRNHPASTLGRPVGCKCWIIDPDCVDRLVPFGGIGELLVEGPVVARGYINDPDKTRSVFIERPSWSKADHLTRFYRTGDLASFNDDGTIRYFGRQDTQVKVHGQRVDLGEIEHCMRQFVASGIETVVDMAHFRGSDKKLLTAFLTEPQHSTEPSFWILHVTQLRRNISDLLPPFMVPSVYLPLREFQYTSSGKTDRRSLRAAATEKTLDEVLAMTVNTEDDGIEWLPSEKVMVSLWSKILRVPTSILTHESEFFHVGGDSISAIRLMSSLREVGLTIKMSDIFSWPTITGMVKRCREMSGTTQSIAPFSMLDGSSKSSTIQELARKCGVSMEQLEDVYPCTPLQQALFALSLRHEGTYVAQDITCLPSDIDISRFKRSWDYTLDRSPILRTRISQSQNSDLVQVVIKEGVEWQFGRNLQQYLDDDMAERISDAGKLVRFAIIQDAASSETFFVWTIHHALYDGWMLSLVLNSVNQNYSGNCSDSAEKLADFKNYVQYTIDVGNQRSESEGYWRAQLVGYVPAPFPPGSARRQAKATRSVEVVVSLGSQRSTHATVACLIRSAWAILVARYTGVLDVCFGETLSGRDAPVEDIDRVVGPTLVTIPVRINLQDHATVEDLLRKSQNIAVAGRGHIGLQNIRRCGDDASAACDFGSLILIQAPHMTEHQPDTLGLRRMASHAKRDLSAFNPYALMAEFVVNDAEIVVTANFDDNIVDEMQIKRYLAYFKYIFTQLMDKSRAKQQLQDFSTISNDDIDEVFKWNNQDLTTVNECLHTKFDEQVAQNPKSEAICAWDGNLTYQRLHELSCWLSGYLIARNVRPGQMIPLFLEKSFWAPVVMLAVLKAGAVCVHIDGAAPLTHIERICTDINGSVAVCSPAYSQKLQALHLDILVPSLLDMSINDYGLPVPRDLVSPSDPAFVVYTSGSTGIPKGIELTHAAMVTSIQHHGKAIKFSRRSRTLQFAAHTFDISNSDIFGTLLNGGCVCIPSEVERIEKLSEFIQRMEVNQACLTSSVASLLTPKAVPTLKLLTIGGEAASAEVINTWTPAVELNNIYGPAEASMWCTVKRNLPAGADPANIGKGMGIATWVVDPDNTDQLLPIGAIGELLIQGPLLARRYLNDTVKTAAAFIEPPKWLKNRLVERATRLYRTGDLVFYNSDGDLCFVGRKDSQAKIRGQRIELGAIEQCIKGHLDVDADVVVEITKPASSSSDTLTAFIVVGKGDRWRDEKILVTDITNVGNYAELLESIKSKLQQTLPEYLRPALYIPIMSMPLTPSGKRNRLKLRSVANMLTREQYAALQGVGNTLSEKRLPNSELEKKVAVIWSTVLRIPVNDVGLDDTFLGLGGDSISAIKIATKARDEGLELSVKVLFARPRLEDLCAVLRSSASNKRMTTNGVSVPFTNGHSRNLRGVRNETYQFDANTMRTFDLDMDQVVSMVPATEYQIEAVGAGCMAYQGYVNHFTMDFSQALAVDRLQQACRSVVASHPSLRTVFIHWRRSLLQVEVRSTSHLACQVRKQSWQRQPRYRLGSQFAQFTLEETEQGCSRLVLTMSHAQYDGISLPMILHDLACAYNDSSPVSRPNVSSVVGDLMKSTSEASHHFRQLLADASQTNIVTHEAPSYQHLTSSTVRRTIQTPPVPDKTRLTFATLLKTAWAMTLHHFTGSTDVAFGTITSGRSANIPGLDAVPAACLATVPVLVRLNYQHTRSQVLEQVRAQQDASWGYEHFSWQTAISDTMWPKWARLSSTVQHQNIDDILADVAFAPGCVASLGAVVSKADAEDVSIYSVPYADGTTAIELAYCKEQVETSLAETFMDVLLDELVRVAETPDIPIGAVNAFRALAVDCASVDVNGQAGCEATIKETITNSNIPESNGKSSRNAEKWSAANDLVDYAWNVVFSPITTTTNTTDDIGPTPADTLPESAEAPHTSTPGSCDSDTPFWTSGAGLIAAAHLALLYSESERISEWCTRSSDRNQEEKKKTKFIVTLEDIVRCPTKRGQVEMILEMVEGV